MGKKVFISYNHGDKKWVRDRLAPVLEAGGAKILIDYREFQGGRTLLGQMDVTQDSADAQILVFTDAYLKSKNCMHEMRRAIATDPDFTTGTILPVQREDCELPRAIRRPNPLYLDMRPGGGQRDPGQWRRLMDFCEADVGVSALTWLDARDEVRRSLEARTSVNLVVPEAATQWQPLLEHVRRDRVRDLGIVDLQSGATASRRGLVAEILRQCGLSDEVPSEPNEDLVTLDSRLKTRSHSTLALLHLDIVTRRQHYHEDLYAALAHLSMEARKLTLLLHSRAGFRSLLPASHPISGLLNVHTVELR